MRGNQRMMGDGSVMLGGGVVVSEPTRTVSRWEQQWPELFASLDAKTRKVVAGVLANHVLQGLEPDREAVADLVVRAGGQVENKMRRRSK